MNEPAWTPSRLLERYPGGIRAERFTILQRLVTAFLFGASALFLSLGAVHLASPILDGVMSLLSMSDVQKDIDRQTTQTHIAEFVAPDKSFAFQASYVRSAAAREPNDPDATGNAIVALENSYTQSPGERLVSRRDLPGEYPGRELMLVNDADGVVTRVRFYVYRQQTVTFTAIGRVAFQTGPDAATFFDSIRLELPILE